MAKTQEIHEIVLTGNSDGLKKVDAEYKVLIEKEKANDKIRIESARTTQKSIIEVRKTAGRLIIQDNDAQNKLLLQKDNVKNQKEIIDYKNAQAEKLRIKRQADAELLKQQKIDSKFTGQSTTLGSVNAITQQIAHYNTLRNSVQANSVEGKKYTDIINNLTAKKRELTGATGGLNAALGGYVGTLVKAYGIQLAYQTSLNSSKFLVMRDMFKGSEKDLEGFRKASANTVTDASLIALSNQASDLNIELRDQTILFAFAENQADKYGTSTEEGFSKVFRIIQGNTKGLKDYGIVTSEFTALTEQLAKVKGKEVDEEIRLQALIQLSNMTYEDAINKTMDMADWHETLGVQVKNVADEHGNWKDLLTSMNPITGFFNVGLEDMAKKETKAKDDAVLLIGTLNEYNNKVPVWGSATESLRGYFINLANTFLQTANDAVTMTEAMNGAVINRQAGDASIPLLAESKIKKIGTSGTGSKSVKEKEEELNLIKLQEAEYKKLELQYDKNLGDLGAQNDLRLKMLNIEREIFRLRTSADITFKNLPGGTGINTDFRNIPGMPSINFDNPLGFKRGFKLKSSNAIDGRPDMTSDELKAIDDEKTRKEQERLGYVNQMWSSTQGMLQDFGFMKGTTAEIVQALNSIISGIGSGFNIIGSIAGIISGTAIGGPVGGVIGGVGGGGGRLGGFTSGISNTPINRFTSSSVSNKMVQVIIKNPVTLARGLETETRYNNVRGGIDL